MQDYRVTLGRSSAEAWEIDVPGAGQASVSDPELADFEARKLLQSTLGLSWAEADDLAITLVDADGEPIHVFRLLFTDSLREPGPAASYAALATDPPAGCKAQDFGTHPGLRCVRRGRSQLDAIATLIAEIRHRYGLEADDLGFEKLWEWAGSRPSREQMVAQLLLMAAHRAAEVGLSTDELVDFVRTVSPSRRS